MREVITDIECPKCKSYYIKSLNKYRHYKVLALCLVLITGCVLAIKSLVDEHDLDRVILLGFLLFSIVAIIGLVFIILTLIKVFSKIKPEYICHLCKTEF